MAGGSNFRDWMRKRMMPRKKAGRPGSGSGVGNSEASPLASSAQPSALRWKKPRGNVLAALFRRVSYHLLWLVESVVVVARLVVFFVRFGLKL
jgi:hypothetical protein